MSKRPRLTLEEKQEIVKLYQEGLTTKELCIKFNYTDNNRHGILNVLKQFNINIRPDNLTHAFKYPINSTYFEKVDTEDKAYFLGLLYADGSNDEEKHNIRLILAEDDKYILETFKNYLQTNKPLRSYKRSKLNPKWKDCFALDIENKRMSEDLAKLGCMGRKTFKLLFPTFLPKELQHHFIRGYFDGDGCITYSKKIINRNQNIHLSFTGTIEFLLELQKILINNLDFAQTKLSKRHKNRLDNIYTLMYTGNLQAIKFKKWLYKDATIYFTRKYNKFF